MPLKMEQARGRAVDNPKKHKRTSHILSTAFAVRFFWEIQHFGPQTIIRWVQSQGQKRSTYFYIIKPF